MNTWRIQTKQTNAEKYKYERGSFFGKLEGYWADLYGQEYSLYDVRPISTEERELIRKSTDRIGHIFFRTAKLLRYVDDDTLLQLGFPEETLRYIKISPFSSESTIARLDLVKAGNSYKVLEINSDTPTFIKEAFDVNGQICRVFGMDDPNEKDSESLWKATRNAIFQSYETLVHFEANTPPNVVYTAHKEHVEDFNTVAYIQNGTKIPAQFIPLDRLQIVEGKGLYDEEGHRIDILYRQTFPIEMAVRDQDKLTGDKIGQWLLELVEMKKLAMINPPSAFLLQSKAVQAIIWGFHEENNPFFTEEEHAWIGEYFLPTYLEPDPFIRTQSAFVKKPSFGREGDTVEIYGLDGRLVLADMNKTYKDYLPVYQQYIDLPTVRFMTENGVQTGCEMVGSFLVDGKASAMGYRAGGRITDNLSYFLPAGITRNKGS